jgi:hypothetical protein
VNRIIRADEAHMAEIIEPELAAASVVEPELSATASDPAIVEDDIVAIDPMHLAHRRSAVVRRLGAARLQALAQSLPPDTTCRGAARGIAAAIREPRRQSDEGRGKWQFRTAKDLSFLLNKHAVEERRLSRAAIETLSIIAYHQPVTRAEIEDIRGVA